MTIDENNTVHLLSEEKNIDKKNTRTYMKENKLIRDLKRKIEVKFGIARKTNEKMEKIFLSG